MRKAKWWGLSAVLAAIGLFVIQNWEPVGVRFLFWSFELPRLVMVLLLLGIGFLAGLLLGSNRDGESRHAGEHVVDDPGSGLGG